MTTIYFLYFPNNQSHCILKKVNENDNGAFIKKKGDGNFSTYRKIVSLPILL